MLYFLAILTKEGGLAMTFCCVTIRASRRLGIELSNEIRASLKQHPRDYLFTEARVSKPYTSCGFQLWASRTLKALFNRPCTLTLLRHSYISYMLAYGQLSIKDREELARDMCHNVTTQAQYQFIEPKGKTVMVQPELQPDFSSSSQGV